MSNESSNPVPGWHPDPYGRHQHRFWDGTAWTGRVANAGVESSDPLPATAPPDTFGTDAPAVAPPSSGSGGRRALAIGTTALVAAAIVVAVVLLVGGNDKKGPSLGTGAGTFTAEMAKGDAKVRTVPMQPGDLVTVSWKVTQGDARVAMAVDRLTGEKLTGKAGFLSDSDLSESLDSAQSLLSDAKDSASALKDTTKQHPYIKVDGFEGIVAGDADAFLTPRSGTFAVIVVGTTKATVKVRVTVKHLGKSTKDLNSAQFDTFTGNLDSEQLSSQFSSQCKKETELTDGFCSSLSDSSDYSSEYSS